MTRTEYLDSAPRFPSPENMAHHRAYYSQFTSAVLQQQVIARFGIAALEQAFAADPHMNGIPLRQWDMMEPIARNHSDKAMRAAGDFCSLGNAVCVLKEAARQAVEDYQDRERDR